MEIASKPQHRDIGISTELVDDGCSATASTVCGVSAGERSINSRAFVCTAGGSGDTLMRVVSFFGIGADAGITFAAAMLELGTGTTEGLAGERVGK